ncbi:MAG TPA: lipid A biosynthesis acyltransferase [Plasticicumulans sp.]|nr:lipid A biosynthesis acyltransferase [Plasticicumulans sp.]
MPPAAARTARGAPAFDRRWLGPRHWPSWGIAGLAWLLQCLPQRARDALARLVLPLVWRLTGRQQHNARINLGLCFPQQPPEWREQVLREHIALAVRVTLDYGLLWFGSATAIGRAVRFHGEEHLAAARAEGRRVILLVAHALALDFGICAFGIRHRALGPYKALADPVIDWLIARARTRFEGSVFEREAGMRPVIRGFRDGQILVYLADEDLGPDGAVFVPFFAEPKATLATLGRLAKLGDARVIPSVTRWNAAEGVYDCFHRPPLADFPSGDAERDARAMNAAVEALITPEPAQYMWTLRLFRTRPSGRAKLYKQRKTPPAGG